MYKGSSILHSHDLIIMMASCVEKVKLLERRTILLFLYFLYNQNSIRDVFMFIEVRCFCQILVVID